MTSRPLMSRATPFWGYSAYSEFPSIEMADKLGKRKKSRLFWNSPGVCLDKQQAKARPSAAILSPHCRDCGWTSETCRSGSAADRDQNYANEVNPDRFRSVNAPIGIDFLRSRSKSNPPREVVQDTCGGSGSGVNLSVNAKWIGFGVR
ncbi:hypothetical protein Bbelb_398680 [Branchiostoma belcheri]|nr:hypothetical protein Bbelb_398680 [Branchiostoma belcheri]